LKDSILDISSEIEQSHQGTSKNSNYTHRVSL